jgi:hypothetical protein
MMTEIKKKTNIKWVVFVDSIMKCSLIFQTETISKEARLIPTTINSSSRKKRKMLSLSFTICSK